MTGSVNITGSLNLIGSLTANAPLTINNSTSGTGLAFAQNWQIGSTGAVISYNGGVRLNINSALNTPINLSLNGTTLLRLTGSSNSVMIQNGGTFTDNGYGLQVDGSRSPSGSIWASGSSVFSGSVTSTLGFTGSLFGTASQATSASYAATASYLLGYISPFPYSGSAQITGSLGVTGSISSTGNITTTGTLTAQTLVVQTITSSIEYSSGSNIFGSRITDTQTMTGSVGITGSLTTIGALSISNDISASNSTQLSFGSNLFLQPSGSVGSAAFEIRAYGGNTYINGGYAFLQPTQPGYNNNITFNQPNSSITILNGNSDAGVTLSRPGANFGEARLTSGNTGTNVPGYITFYTSGSEKVRIDGSGSLLIGTNTSNGYLTSINANNINRFPNGALYVTGSSSFTGSVNVSGNITTTGTLTAQTLVVQTITSSIEYSSGSNIFGSQITDTQTMTGSVNITGSFTQVGYQILTAVSQSFNYANDAAAAAGGIPLGGLYRNGNAIQIRLV